MSQNPYNLIQGSLFSNEEIYKAEVSKLTVLSMGLGQDSTTILLKLIYDKSFRAKYAPHDLLVLFANTHNEHPETYKYRDEVIIPLCKKHNIDFISLNNDMGYHSNSWQGLTERWSTGGKKREIASVAFNPQCSHNLKLRPQYAFVEEYISQKYPMISFNGRKKGYVQFAKQYGKIRWLIGIARGEESRIFDAEKETLAWKRQSVHIEYPLIDIGYNRQDCQDYIRQVNYPIPMPSNCMFCPYVACNAMELLWLEKTYPDKFEQWCKHEQAKLNDWQHIERNVGVSGKFKEGKAVTLKEMLEDAKSKYPNITLAELNEYKWSHGHCVKSKY